MENWKCKKMGHGNLNGINCKFGTENGKLKMEKRKLEFASCKLWKLKQN